uniref:Uncharacterized protein n=1 Tax=Rhizophora mucronata TaxID=61149 RepID=A0A2P2QQ80_RHIMU
MQLNWTKCVKFAALFGNITLLRLEGHKFKSQKQLFCGKKGKITYI